MNIAHAYLSHKQQIRYMRLLRRRLTLIFAAAGALAFLGGFTLSLLLSPAHLFPAPYRVQITEISDAALAKCQADPNCLEIQIQMPEGGNR